MEMIMRKRSVKRSNKTRTKTNKMKTTTQEKNRAYKVGEFYVKNPTYNPELNEFVYELTTDVN